MADHLFGWLSFATADGNVKLRCDRIAIDERGGIYLASVVGKSNQIKAVRALLADKRRERLKIDHDDLTFRRVMNGREEAVYPYDRSKACVLHPTDRGYQCHIERFEYDEAHALFLSKDPAFLVNVSGESLWQAVQSPAFTTPVLRPWMRWIIDRMLAASLLTYTFGWRCRCGLLGLSTDLLDEIVSEGLRTGALTLDDRMPTAAREGEAA